MRAEITMADFLAAYETGSLQSCNFLVGPQGPFQATVKRHKLAWCGHVTCHDSLSKTILRVPGMVGDAMVGRGNA